MLKAATDWDHRIIDSVSYALHGNIGTSDDVERLRAVITPKDGDTTRVACEIAVAFIRWAQDLKAELDELKSKKS